MNADAATKTLAMTNKELLFTYVVPYVAFVAIASLPRSWLSFEWNYAVRLLVVVPLLIFAWRYYTSLTGPKNPLVSAVVGTFAGILGTVLWIVLLQPFTSSEGEPWSRAAFTLRLMTAGLVVPVFEELLMRGYVLRLALQWDLARKAGQEDPFGKAFYESSINQVSPGSWSVPAVIISSFVFALGHQTREWPAAVVYGLLMAALWITRKDLLSCMVAHGTTNIALALYVWMTQQWKLW